MSGNDQELATRKLREAKDAWWREISAKGDPAHRTFLVDEAFVAGWEAGALFAIGEMRK